MVRTFGTASPDRFCTACSHAFQKKSKAGIATPKPEMELIRQRLKELRSEVKNAEKRGP
jgi:hypothetical protein